MAFLSLDLGTTVCKGALFNIEGELLDLVREEYPVISPHPDWAEQDPEVVWEKVQKVILTITKRKKSNEKIESICISAQGEAVCFLDKNSRPLRNSILGMDMRSRKQVEKLTEEFGYEKLYNISGVPPHPLTTLAKILWVKENEPFVFARTRNFLCYEDFVFLRLGGKPFIDYSLASRMMMFDIERKRWCDFILDYTGIKEEQLAKVFPSGTVVGRIKRDMADKLGLPQDTVLVTGGHDVTCAALGAGAVDEGVGADILGTAEIFGLSVKDKGEVKKINPPNFACYAHVIPGRYFLMTLNQTGGLLLKWFRDNFGEKEVELAEKEKKDAFEILIEKAKKTPAQSMVLPHFVGSGTPFIDAKSKGAILGLSLHTDKSDIIKALLESVCFEQKINIEIFERAGLKVNEIRAVGGQTRSDEWLRIRACILGKKIRTLETSEASCLGAAILSAFALGYYPSIEEAVSRMVKVRSEINPDRTLQEKYLKKYWVYKKLYPALKKINHELSKN